MSADFQLRKGGLKHPPQQVRRASFISQTKRKEVCISLFRAKILFAPETAANSASDDM